MHADIVKRFWSKVNKQGPYPHKTSTVKTRCWEWTGGFLNGYGSFCKHTLAHRFAYKLYHGKHSLDGLGQDGRPWKVLHKCDNKKCIREVHLFKGTQQENVDDMIAKGRHNFIAYKYCCNKGEDCHLAKLTVATVITIRRLYATGNYSYSDLGKKFNVTYSNIGCIIRRTSWVHVR